MGQLTNMLQLIVGTSGEPESGTKPVVCPECKAEGIPSQARNSSKWLAVHLGGCSRRTVWGEDREDVTARWMEQNL